MTTGVAVLFVVKTMENNYMLHGIREIDGLFLLFYFEGKEVTYVEERGGARTL